MADAFGLNLPTDPNYYFSNSPAASPIGLPADQQPTDPPPGFESTVASISAPPAIATVSPSIWNTIKQDSQSALTWTENEIKAGYSTGKSAVSTVVSDVTAPVTGAVKTIYLYAILGVIVLAGAIYFIGRGGAIGQAGSFVPKV